MTIDMSQFHNTFFEECFEGLAIMESELLTLDSGEADEETINTIFRAAHSIKGGAGTFGFMNISEFTHVVETLLDEMRDGSREVTSETVDALLESVDVIRSMLEAVRDQTEVDEAMVADKYAVLEKILKSSSDTSRDTSTPSESSNVSQKEDTDAGKSELKTWEIEFIPHTTLLATGNDPVRMFRALTELGELQTQVNTEKLLPLSEINPEDLFLSWKLILKGDVSEDEIFEVFEWVEDQCELTIEQVTTEQMSGEQAPEQQSNRIDEPEKSAKNAEKTSRKKVKLSKSAKSDKSTETSSIRVDTNKIDEIINLVGELVITQSMLDQAGEDLNTIAEESADRTTSEILLRLSEGLAQLERNTRELQEGVMRIRMLPISFVFSRMPRLVHDLSNKLSKKIELVVSGEETELDKTVMENIGDPLVHIVRNSMDHGIETPEQRLAAGKNEVGTVELKAFHQGGSIVIEIKDDGAGVNKERVLAKAIEKGIVEADAELTGDEINNLLFAPGFSTAETISDVSGRGVGMDVVKTSITNLGGRVTITSEEGEGTTITIRLPLTLAILDGQLVTVGDQSYVIPLISIVESLQIDNKKANIVAGKAEVYKLREEYIPIIRSRAVLGLEDDKAELDKSLMVVVEANGSPAGIIVDDLQGQQQVVIKSLETNYRKVETMSGATILGDGTVALIWDINGMVDSHNKNLNKYAQTA